MRVLVLGAGGVGIAFTSRLARAGAEVSVVAGRDHDVASRQGYDVRMLDGNYNFTPHAVLRSAREFEGIPDWVIVACKALPSIDMVELLRPAVRSEQTKIMLIQNGIDIEKEVYAAYPQNLLVSTVAYTCTSRPAPGVILNEGVLKLRFGDYPSGVSPATEEIAELFRQGGVDCRTTEDINYIRWYKLLWNLSFNVVAVLGKVNTAEMCDNGPLEDLCRRLMQETKEVACACGAQLTGKDIDDNFAFTRTLKPYIPSTCQDYYANRPMEVEAILGNPIRLAHKHNVPVPCMELCYTLLSALNKGK
ncbi:MAG: ketopantoate reductase family protein [Lentisphaeria bacterium]|nr:ketopantoate reductase family protein [Lentisphaeria bacterium]